MAENPDRGLLIETPAEREKRKATEEKRRDNKYRRLQLWFNGILMLASIITLGALVYQNYVLRQSVNEIFPGDPMIQRHTVGPTMEAVNTAVIRDGFGLDGKVAFALVGCISYRSPFDTPNSPYHQTRFIYYLGAPIEEGGFVPYTVPKGVATDLRLVVFPDGFSAD